LLGVRLPEQASTHDEEDDSGCGGNISAHGCPHPSALWDSARKIGLYLLP